jgi:DNA-binding NarL/FixJ family response regulator
VVATGTDELSVVEAAYRLEGSEEEWLDRIVAATKPLFADLAIAAVSFGPAATGELRIEAAAGSDQRILEAALLSGQESAYWLMHEMLRAARCTTVRQCVAVERLEADPAYQHMLRVGVRDALGIFGAGSDGRGACMAVFLPTITRWAPRCLERWNRVGSHLGAGLRMRRALAAISGGAARAAAVDDGAEAVLTASGAVAHVGSRDAEQRRSQLARAVLSMDRARGPLRRKDAGAALDAWKGLVAGRWSLIEHFDSDGKRFLVARRNDPDAPGPNALLRRERQVLAYRARGLSMKLIAYELGLSVGCVSRNLASGMAKLKLSCHAELVRLFDGRAS